MVFRTNKNAPNYRLIIIDLNNYKEENWGTLLEVMNSLERMWLKKSLIMWPKEIPANLLYLLKSK